MRFKTKDLMVSVNPRAEISDELKAKLCALHSRICVRPTLEPCARGTLGCANHTIVPCFGGTFTCSPCSVQATCACTFQGTQGCGFLTCGHASACDPTYIPCFGSFDFVIEDLEDLVTVRDELKQTLKQLDEIEAAGLPGAIRSVEEAETLERALTAALREVQARKGQLK